MSFIMDTNVLSEARRSAGSPRVKAWVAATPASDLHLSVLVLGEVRRGVERLRRRDPVQAAIFETWLTRIRRDFRDRILPVTAEIAEEWGRLNVPDPVPTVDGLIAATALVHGLTVATRNTADFARTGVPTFNPFEPFEFAGR